MYDIVIDRDPLNLRHVPAKFKIRQKFHYLPDWFIIQEMIENGSGCCGCSKKGFREWFKGYKQRKAKKYQIKDELASIASHPDIVIDWCFFDDEKKNLKQLWGEDLQCNSLLKVKSL